MVMKRILLFTLSALSFFAPTPSQVIKPVKWSFSVRDVDETHVDLIFIASITPPWHMYGLNIPENGPIPASIHFNDPKGFTLAAKPTQAPKPEIVDDKIFNMKLELHKGQVTFTQRIRKTQTDSIIISGSLEFMTCNDMQCVLGDHDFIFRVKGLSSSVPPANPLKTVQDAGKAVPDTAVAHQLQATSVNSVSTIPAATKSSSTPASSLWGVLLLAMLAGLGGLLTPCVYPMIPMTVSFFLRGSKTRVKAISEALVFGLSIVLLYTLIGVLVAVFKNPNAVNNFTTHWATNTIFFVIFIALSASFFGMFEIILPSGLANRVDRQADKGGYAGAFFMALAMAILSFSCTGPIVASLLIKASQGEVLEPVIGMAGFSLVFALPFTLFAIFPSWLKSLPKSGGWLNGVKIFFAFIMLAFSLYFLGKIDQSYHLNLLGRDVFLILWIVIFTLMGLYFLGKIRFTHDDESVSVGFPRLLISIASFAFSLYLFTGLLGAELKSLSTLIPPPGKASLSVFNSPSNSTASSNSLCNVPKYSDFLELPHGLQGYFDYDEALECARQQHKPVLVDFVGHTCSNCKKMYSEVWSDPRVLELLSKKFIIAALYTDDRAELPKNEWVTSAVDGKVKNTIGKKNQDLQIRQFVSNALPLYIIVDAEGRELTANRYTYDPDIEKFIAWLQEGIR
jgi:thiol:disulfide interchange protein